MNKIDSRTSREKLAAIVSKQFQQLKLDAVLVGGAVVSIYTDNNFVNAPVAVGNKIVREPARRKTKWGEIRLLSPLDCALDRLAAFLHWNDRQCLLQAAHVAAKHDVDLSEVRAWLEHEDGDRAQNSERFAELKARVEELTAAKTPRRRR